LPEDPPPLEFQVSDPEVLRSRLIEAGLRDVKVHTEHQETIEVRSGRHLWDWVLGGNPIPGMLVADLSEQQKESVRQHLDEVVRARSKGQGRAVLTAPVNIGIGTK
jgi:hypothetical protein